MIGRRREPARLGRRGERRAARWLRRRGYRILRRNPVVGGVEADLLAEAPDGRTIVVVEVKTRGAVGRSPAANLGPAKRRRLQRFVRALRRRGEYRERPIRIDAVTIVWPAGEAPRVRHYPSVFGA